MREVLFSGKSVDNGKWVEEYFCPTAVPYDDNPDRSRGAKAFKKNKRRKKTADKSKRANRRKR